MDASEVADAFGVMALLAVAGVVLAAAVAAASPASRRPLADLVADNARVSTWLVAVVAVGGSLWFSQAADFPPCTLCWYQRIAMYPLVVVLGIRAGRRTGSPDLRLAGLVLVAAGLLVNVWHVAIETWPTLDTGACAAAVPCTVRWVEGLGYFTIPRLATVAFGLIGLGLLADRSDGRADGGSADLYAADDLAQEEEPA